MKHLARYHGITLGYNGRKVPHDTLRLILQGLGQNLNEPPKGPAAPDRISVSEGAECYLPPSLKDAPGWGIFCQLYEIRSDRSWGIGDFADLALLARICADAGADFLGVNPVHALFTSTPERASPFSPSNRQFLNPLYIAPDRLGASRPTLNDGDTVDYSKVAETKLTALRHVFDGFSADPALSKFIEDGGEPLRLHALFEALSHVHGGGWQDWPEPFQDPKSAQVAKFADDYAVEVRFHLWLQWIARAQLSEAQNAAKDGGMRLGLYLDLAVGEALDGSATWSNTATALPGLTIGAPPDVFSDSGQNWHLTAPSPVTMRETGFNLLREIIGAQLVDAGALRIDHVMALWQLYLIPEGAPASEGTHLRYPIQEMLQVLVEASRNTRAVVIGEDLGFVPEGFREAMEKACILSYRIVYFEQSEDGFNAADSYPELALACLSTHDLPTLAGWWDGIDIDLREQNKLVSAEISNHHRKHREWERVHLARALGVTDPDEDTLLDAAHRFIASTPSLLVGVRLADLVGPRRPTNLPGVTDGYPNWRPRSPTQLEDIADHPTFARTTHIMRKARPRPR
tara:strand:- start:10258 stop:11973 length:1716 start_codon:yes stop_codon:yes gene_type:complete